MDFQVIGQNNFISDTLILYLLVPYLHISKSKVSVRGQWNQNFGPLKNCLFLKTGIALQRNVVVIFC
jgi:hypothetical protein